MALGWRWRAQPSVWGNTGIRLLPSWSRRPPLHRLPGQMAPQARLRKWAWGQWRVYRWEEGAHRGAWVGRAPAPRWLMVQPPAGLRQSGKELGAFSLCCGPKGLLQALRSLATGTFSGCLGSCIETSEDSGRASQRGCWLPFGSQASQPWPVSRTA